MNVTGDETGDERQPSGQRTDGEKGRKDERRGEDSLKG